jgi:malonate-semialdehyde dehydrogenase (acetylating)/methylmalonate-semialdehyde dehydrogenase
MTTETAVRTLQNFIAGAWQPAAAEGYDDVPNPATGEVLARVPLSSAADVDAAVRAAAAAFPAWAATPVVERARLLFRYKMILEEHLDELTLLVTRENGKTLADARGEVRRGIEVVEFACGAPTLLMGDTLPDVARGIDCETFRVPVGVVAGITPFNFPMMVPHWMFPIALACGNTFVLKPSERTPLTAVRFTELLLEAGLPAGVLNVVHGAHAAVNALLTHPGVAAVSFVGSQPVAEHVYRTAAAHGKRVQALAGAKNHLIVMPDADLDATVDAVMSSAFGAAGERCLAGSVLVAVGEVGDAVVEKLAHAAGRLRVGNGADSATEMGPVIRASACERIAGYVERGLAEGARLVVDGRVESSEQRATSNEGGYFLRPTIFDAVRPEMSIAQDEIFGPVLSVVRVPDLDAALDTLNASRFGNAASIFTRSGAAARAFRQRAQAGMLGVNIGVAAPMAFFPFAGHKQSFYGDLHATGKDAVAFYTEQKVVTSRWT